MIDEIRRRAEDKIRAGCPFGGGSQKLAVRIPEGIEPEQALNGIKASMAVRPISRCLGVSLKMDYWDSALHRPVLIFDTEF